jgi:PUA domain protein
VARLAAALSEALGCPVFSPDDTVDRASEARFDGIFVNGALLALVVDDRPFLTVRGLLRYEPMRRHVTVDMGAVPYVYNGADVMAPGIVDADEGIRPGDLVWVREERHGRPLAVGEALLSGPEMIQGRKGKAVKSMHHVGDALWTYDEGGS